MVKAVMMMTMIKWMDGNSHVRFGVDDENALTFLW